MKLSVQKSAAKCLLLAIGLLHFNLVHCELARQSTLNLQSAEREWLPIPHTHDGTNTEGGGVRINRHTLQDPMEVHDRDDNDSMIKSRPPTFKDSNPVKITQVFSSYANLDCSLKSFKSKVNVTWLKDGMSVDLKNESYKIVDKNLSLVIENSRVKDSGNYTCVVKSKGYKTIKKHFEVTFVFQSFGKPILKESKPGNETLIRGSNFTLKCEVLNLFYATPFEYVWVRHFPDTGFKLFDDSGQPNFEILQRCSHVGICIDRKTNTSYLVDMPSEYNLTNLQESSWYSCNGINEFGTDWSSGYIWVVDEIPIDQNVLEERQQKKTIVSASLSVSVICVLFVGLLAGVACIFKRRAKNELQKRQKTEEYAKSVIIWTKRVMVRMDSEDQQQCQDGSEKPLLLYPQVTIEKQRISVPPRSGIQSEEDNGHGSEYTFDTDPEWEFDRRNLVLGSVLGEGQFGRVVSATAVGIRGCQTPITVAIKMLKDGHQDMDVIDMISEMTIMKRIGCHDNIINLLGVCTQPSGQPLFVIVEFAKFGNLRDYLLVNRPRQRCPLNSNNTANNHAYMTPLSSIRPGDILRPKFVSILCEPVEGQLQLRDQLNMAWQVAKGMMFLAMKKCVHRDLAARNVLVCENNVYKIADFGMARNTVTSDYYRKATSSKVPLKWMAPEAINKRIYTTQSDVWSYGVLLWEIMSFGDSPYNDVNVDVLVDLIRHGNHLQKPQDCPEDVYQLMKDTWHFEPKDRPSWADIVENTHKLLGLNQPNNYLTLSSDCEDYYEGSPTSFKMPISPPPTPTHIVEMEHTIAYVNQTK